MSGAMGPRLLNDEQLAGMLADRAMRGWDGLGEAAIGGMVKALARRFLTRAEAVRGECRVVIKGVFVPPYTVDQLRAELDLGDAGARWVVDIGLGGEGAADPTVGMVLVVRGLYPTGVHCVVAAAGVTYGHLGIDAGEVAAGRWPPGAALDALVGPGARRIDA